MGRAEHEHKQFFHLRISFKQTMYLMETVQKALRTRAEQIVFVWLYLGIW